MPVISKYEILYEYVPYANVGYGPVLKYKVLYECIFVPMYEVHWESIPVQKYEVLCEHITVPKIKMPCRWAKMEVKVWHTH